MVLYDTFLEHAAKLIPECLVFLRILAGQPLQFVQDLLDGCALDLVDFLVVLQEFPRDVERQVRRIHDTPDETKISRHQVFCIVHDKDTPDVQFDAMSSLTVPKVERRPRRDEEQGDVLQLALDPVVQHGQRWVRIIAEGIVERLILLLADLFLIPGPQG